MADNEFGLTDAEMAQLINQVADCLGADIVNQLVSGAQVLQPGGESKYFIRLFCMVAEASTVLQNYVSKYGYL
jgi:DhnA family fructose-bisphosphate aldolase class Ia